MIGKEDPQQKREVTRVPAVTGGVMQPSTLLLAYCFVKKTGAQELATPGQSAIQL